MSIHFDPKATGPRTSVTDVAYKATKKTFPWLLVTMEVLVTFAVVAFCAAWIR